MTDQPKTSGKTYKQRCRELEIEVANLRAMVTPGEIERQVAMVDALSKAMEARKKENQDLLIGASFAAHAQGLEIESLRTARETLLRIIDKRENEIIDLARKVEELEAEVARLSTPLKCYGCEEDLPLIEDGLLHCQDGGIVFPCVGHEVAERNAEIASLRAEVAALLKQQERDMETIWRIQQKVGNAGLCIPCVLGHDKFKLGSDGRLLHDDSAHDESALWSNGGVDYLCNSPNAEAVAALVRENAALREAVNRPCQQCADAKAYAAAKESDAIELLDKIAALRALVQEAEWATNAEECPWCDWASPVHRPDCKAAKVMGWRTE